jgi:hypothetical protein
MSEELTQEDVTDARREAHLIRAAHVAHEANRVYCETIGDFSQPVWSCAPAWQTDSAIGGMKLHFAAYDAGEEVAPEASHDAWLKHKRAGGWKYGAVKNPTFKEHPCMVPYDELPDEQKVKDALFTAIARAFAASRP